MTINIALTTITDGIANLSIGTIGIRDVDNIPDRAVDICPVLFPNPNSFITNPKPTRQTFGAGGTAAMDFSYDLNYVFLQQEASLRYDEFRAMYPAMLSNIILIWKAIFENDDISGCIDMELSTMGVIGLIEDTDKNQYWGTTFSFHVVEQIQ